MAMPDVQCCVAATEDAAVPIPAPTAERVPLHTRSIQVQGYKRADGLYDIEAHLIDSKAVDFRLASGVRPAGAPIHDMWLRITVDEALHIVDAAASTDAMPYPGDCDRIAPAYHQLVGLAIRPGFANAVRQRFGGTAGCTHLTDLIGVAATTAFQTLAGQASPDPDRKPFQLDRCHALKVDAPAVQKYYPRWFRKLGHEQGEAG